MPSRPPLPHWETGVSGHVPGGLHTPGHTQQSPTADHTVVLSSHIWPCSSLLTPAAIRHRVPSTWKLPNGQGLISKVNMIRNSRNRIQIFTESREQKASRECSSIRSAGGEAAGSVPGAGVQPVVSRAAWNTPPGWGLPGPKG